jgi:hypothetical protein
MLGEMESQPSPAEELPALYRTILDGVALLEQLGERREAALVRAEATKAYSHAWDDRCRRRLMALRRRIDRTVASGNHSRPARRVPPLLPRDVVTR